MKTQQGQSTIEYLFLMVVVVALFYSFFKSRYLQDYTDELFSEISDSIQFSYHHGAPSGGRTYSKSYSNPGYGKTPHSTYYIGGKNSHFFISHEQYPQ